MTSYWKLPLKGQCESHSCESVGIGRCSREGNLYLITSDIHVHVNEQPWEQYSCEEAVQIDRNNGFISHPITEEVEEAE